MATSNGKPTPKAPPNRAARRAAAKKDTPAAEAPAPNAIVVHVVYGDNGTISAHPEILGDVRATEVETLLKLALARWRETIGTRE